MGKKTTYEEFYKSVEYLSVEEYEERFTEVNHDKVTGVFCYLGCGLHIDCMENGYGLILDRTYHESDALHELEEKLYAFCDEEGYLDEVEPTDEVSSSTGKEKLAEYLSDEGLLKDILFEYLADSLEWHPDVEDFGLTQDEIIEVLGDIERKTIIKLK